VLEAYDFGDPNFKTVQEHVSTFIVSSDGIFDSFICWIVVDMGTGIDPRTTARQRSRVAVDQDEQTAFTEMNNYTAGPSFTSKDGTSTTATNWERPCVLLPSPLRVSKGDSVEVKTTVRADSSSPNYRFTYKVIRRNAPESNGTIHLDYDDVRPIYYPSNVDTTNNEQPFKKARTAGPIK
jgi:hypothetical protein